MVKKEDAFSEPPYNNIISRNQTSEHNPTMTLSS